MLIRKIVLSCLAAILAMSALAERADAYYSPTKGRFISRDPIEERGGLNLYGFAKNDPIDSIDVNGQYYMPVSAYTKACLQRLSSGMNQSQQASQEAFDLINNPEQYGFQQIPEITYVVLVCPCCEVKLFPDTPFDTLAHGYWPNDDDPGDVQTKATEVHWSPKAMGGDESCVVIQYVMIHSEKNGWPALPAHLPTENEVGYICATPEASGRVCDEEGQCTDVTCPYSGACAQNIYAGQ